MTQHRTRETQKAYSDSIIIPITLTVPASALLQGRVKPSRVGVPPFRGWPKKPVLAEQKSRSERLERVEPHVLRVQLGPDDSVKRPGVEQMAQDIQAEAEGRPVPIRPSRLRFTPDETQKLKLLFGQRPEAAKELVEQLRSNVKILLPPGVTKEVLERYVKVAESAISRGLDKIETQKWRLEAIRLILKELP